MKLRVAANIVFKARHVMCRNLVVERDESGAVIDFLSIDEAHSEPSGTVFYNGIITPQIAPEMQIEGARLDDIINVSITKGYNGDLLLWQGISLTERVITKGTTFKKL